MCSSVKEFVPLNLKVVFAWLCIDHNYVYLHDVRENVDITS